MKIRPRFFLARAFVALSFPLLGSVSAASQPDLSDPRFWPPFQMAGANRDLSPYTGLDRDGWIACGKHILEGAFHHVRSLHDPMFLPKMPGPGYPAKSNEAATPRERNNAIFEAISRTFNIAAPLIKNDPDITIRGIRLHDYYKYHLLELLTNPQSAYFIGRARDFDTHRQQTCELGNLAMWMILAPEVFWDALSSDEKKKVATTLQEWSVSHTLSHNWRWFNVMMITFLAINGYEHDEKLMLNHVDNLILQHAGNGWYRDTSYDYYTAHVFHLYGAVWASRFGRTRYPERAALLDRHFEEFSDHYPQIFGRNGEVIMYGRSILYRLGASVGMVAAQFRGQSTKALPPGLALRVASGALLQFTTHPDFFYRGVPALGFYGLFPPAIQNYSSSGSTYWMFLNFAGLLLPKDHAFWTAKEEMGAWGNLGKKDIYNQFWPGPGFLVTNHGETGVAEIRPSKIRDQNPNYSRLVYNSAFPWENASEDGIVPGALTFDAGNYQSKLSSYVLPTAVSSAGFRDGVLYRQAMFTYHVPPTVDMATIMIPGGEIRLDRLRRIYLTSVRISHFGLPHIKGEPVITRTNIAGHASLQAAIPGRQLALTVYQGWSDLAVRSHTGRNPEAARSTVIYATATDRERFAAPDLLVSVLLHRTDDTPWTEDQLQPIESITPLQPGGVTYLTGARVRLKSGKEYRVDFQNIDGTNSTW